MSSLIQLAKRLARGPYFLARRVVSRFRLPVGVAPLSVTWGFDRGLPIHRFYLEQFLREVGYDIRGHCMEFQEDNYTSRFGTDAVTQLDILHLDDSNPAATLVADLEQDNDIADESFDCIICTHVLNVICDLGRFISELHRILKPCGVLLVAVPHVSMYAAAASEYWRFTPGGLGTLLSRAFGEEQVLVRAYGNSLTAAGEIRGLVAEEFSKTQLRYHDPRFAVEVCARAVKA